MGLSESSSLQKKKKDVEELLDSSPSHLNLFFLILQQDGVISSDPARASARNILFQTYDSGLYIYIYIKQQ
jgi:hypothetical protein